MNKIKLITGFSLLSMSLAPLMVVTSCNKDQPAKADFATDTWENVCAKANEGLEALKKHYGVETFVGLERKISIKNTEGLSIEHKVRVIGEDHDVLAGDSSKKAALTFELVNVVTVTSLGGTLNCKRSDTGVETEADYIDCTLRANLEKSKFSEITSSVKWTTPDAYKTSTKDMYTMLSESEAVLTPNIKKVVKHVHTSGTSNLTAYNSYLFALTNAEMAQNDTSVVEKEGSAYKYWSEHNSDQYRVKKNALEQATIGCIYRLASHNTSSPSSSFIIDSSGKIESSWSNKAATPISFAFCI